MSKKDTATKGGMNLDIDPNHTTELDQDLNFQKSVNDIPKYNNYIVKNFEAKKESLIKSAQKSISYINLEPTPIKAERENLMSQEVQNIDEQGQTKRQEINSQDLSGKNNSSQKNPIVGATKIFAMRQGLRHYIFEKKIKKMRLSLKYPALATRKIAARLIQTLTSSNYSNSNIAKFLGRLSKKKEQNIKYQNSKKKDNKGPSL